LPGNKATRLLFVSQPAAGGMVRSEGTEREEQVDFIKNVVNAVHPPHPLGVRGEYRQIRRCNKASNGIGRQGWCDRFRWSTVMRGDLGLTAP